MFGNILKKNVGNALASGDGRVEAPKKKYYSGLVDYIAILNQPAGTCIYMLAERCCSTDYTLYVIEFSWFHVFTPFK